MNSIIDLMPEIELALTSVRDHAMYSDTGALNSTEIAILKGDLNKIVTVLNLISGYLLAEARAAEIIKRAEDHINRGKGN